MIKLISAFAALLIASAPAFANAPEELGDERIRTEIYSKQRVYDINASVGRAALIQFEEDESLVLSPSSILGIGDADAWKLGVRGNNLVIKPAQNFPRTNLIVVTNKRTYAFDLRLIKNSANATYVIRFRYLDTEAAQVAAANAAEAKRISVEAAKNAVKIKINTAYSWRGSNALLVPSAAFDDGRFTKLVYDHAGELPVFYKVLSDGSEALLNYHIDSEDRSTVVLHEVIRKVRARINNEIIEIINDDYKLPKLNRTGTSVPGVSRIIKD